MSQSPQRTSFSAPAQQRQHQSGYDGTEKLPNVDAAVAVSVSERLGAATVPDASAIAAAIGPCLVCGAMTKKRCKHCAVARFCSTGCFREGWTSHSQECCKSVVPRWFSLLCAASGVRIPDDELSCDMCGAPYPSVKCNSCRVALYCSEKCSKADSDRHSGGECERAKASMFGRIKRAIGDAFLNMLIGAEQGCWGGGGGRGGAANADGVWSSAHSESMLATPLEPSSSSESDAKSKRRMGARKRLERPADSDDSGGDFGRGSKKRRRLGLARASAKVLKKRSDAANRGGAGTVSLYPTLKQPQPDDEASKAATERAKVSDAASAAAAAAAEMTTEAALATPVSVTDETLRIAGQDQRPLRFLSTSVPASIGKRGKAKAVSTHKPTDSKHAEKKQKHYRSPSRSPDSSQSESSPDASSSLSTSSSSSSSFSSSTALSSEEEAERKRKRKRKEHKKRQKKRRREREKAEKKGKHHSHRRHHHKEETDEDKDDEDYVEDLSSSDEDKKKHKKHKEHSSHHHCRRHRHHGHRRRYTESPESSSSLSDSRSSEDLGKHLHTRGKGRSEDGDGIDKQPCGKLCRQKISSSIGKKDSSKKGGTVENGEAHLGEQGKKKKAPKRDPNAALPGAAFFAPAWWVPLTLRDRLAKYPDISAVPKGAKFMKTAVRAYVNGATRAVRADPRGIAALVAILSERPLEDCAREDFVNVGGDDRVACLLMKVAPSETGTLLPLAAAAASAAPPDKVRESGARPSSPYPDQPPLDASALPVTRDMKRRAARAFVKVLATRAVKSAGTKSAVAKRRRKLQSKKCDPSNPGPAPEMRPIENARMGGGGEISSSEDSAAAASAPGTPPPAAAAAAGSVSLPERIVYFVTRVNPEPTDVIAAANIDTLEIRQLNDEPAILFGISNAVEELARCFGSPSKETQQRPAHATILRWAIDLGLCAGCLARIDKKEKILGYHDQCRPNVWSWLANTKGPEFRERYSSNELSQPWTGSSVSDRFTEAEAYAARKLEIEKELEEDDREFIADDGGGGTGDPFLQQLDGADQRDGDGSSGDERGGGCDYYDDEDDDYDAAVANGDISEQVSTELGKLTPERLSEIDAIIDAVDSDNLAEASRLESMITKAANRVDAERAARGESAEETGGQGSGPGALAKKKKSKAYRSLAVAARGGVVAVKTASEIELDGMCAALTGLAKTIDMRSRKSMRRKRAEYVEASIRSAELRSEMIDRSTRKDRVKEIKTELYALELVLLPISRRSEEAAAAAVIAIAQEADRANAARIAAAAAASSPASSLECAPSASAATHAAAAALSYRTFSEQASKKDAVSANAPAIATGSGVDNLATTLVALYRAKTPVAVMRALADAHPAKATAGVLSERLNKAGASREEIFAINVAISHEYDPNGEIEPVEEEPSDAESLGDNSDEEAEKEEEDEAYDCDDIDEDGGDGGGDDGSIDACMAENRIYDLLGRGENGKFVVKAATTTATPSHPPPKTVEPPSISAGFPAYDTSIALAAIRELNRQDAENRNSRPTPAL